jgi:hypothetical protein
VIKGAFHDDIVPADIKVKSVDVGINKKKKKKEKREFDMSNYKQRHVAIRIMYDGREYAGFAAQDENGNHKTDNKRQRGKKKQANSQLAPSTSHSSSDQGNNSRLETVEKHLAFAFAKTRLFVQQKSNNTSEGQSEGAEEIDANDGKGSQENDGLPRLVSGTGYSRCGRTDRGVSALGQVRMGTTHSHIYVSVMDYPPPPTPFPI